MWVSRKDTWHKDTTDLEKFMAERLIQRCDYEESVSKKHRTVSGFTQLKELIKLCELYFYRNRTIRSLTVLLDESKSRHIKQNILNDRIISIYFTDLKAFIDDYDVALLKPQNNNGSLSAVTKLLHELKNYEKQLDKYYLPSLEKELLSIDFKETEKFHREAKKISELVDLIIPYFLFQGYSTISVNEVLRKWLERSYRVTAHRLLNFFNFNNSDFEFIINLSNKDDASKDFLRLISQKAGKSKVVKKEIVNKSIDKHQQIKFSSTIIAYDHSCFDPNAHIRNMYDDLLKQLVIGKDRKSLAPFTDYFNNCYWANKKHHKKRYFKARILGDPISIPARTSTLRNTLIFDPSVESFKTDSEIQVPKNEQLKKAIYYYNLALGSKSLENSLSLLWTSIETIIPYRIFTNDIDCVKHLLGKSLSIGAFCRDINSFAIRFKILNQQNDNILIPLNTSQFESNYSDEGIGQWYNWLCDTSNVETKFNLTKKCSQLLAYEYMTLGKAFSENKIRFLIDRFEASKLSIEFQLQRIYLHRNQIVHSGDLINEYSNLWTHLEWYSGKLLFYALKSIEIEEREKDLETAFRQLEADYDYMMSYLNKNSSKKIAEVSKIKELILQHNWQAF